MIVKTLALGLVLAGSIGLAHADYAEGMGHYEQQEYRQALQAFRDAANRGDADAQYMLGRLDEAGNGTTQDFVAAHKWYNLAAARGHGHAAEARDALADRMTDGQIAEAQQAAREWQPQETASRGAPPRSRPDINTLSYRERVAEIQHELDRLGYDAGPTDGLMGDRTRSAIHAYRADMGMARDGRATSDLLRRLRATQTADLPEHSQPGARSRVVLQDDFGDGDYRRDPAWTVLSGAFEVDANGLRTAVGFSPAAERLARGLSSDRPEEIGLAVLGMVLEQREDARRGGDAEAAEPARIMVDAPVDYAFGMEAEIASRGPIGRLELGLFQGDRPQGHGYRLVYAAESRPGLRLTRRMADGTETLARQDGRIDLEDGRFHAITWSRDESGLMEVHVDDRPLLRVRDTGLRDPFQGFMLANEGGDFSLRRIRIEER